VPQEFCGVGVLSFARGCIVHTDEGKFLAVPAPTEGLLTLRHPKILGHVGFGPHTSLPITSWKVQFRVSNKSGSRVSVQRFQVAEFFSGEFENDLIGCNEHFALRTP
jgi:hypothetical protein